MPQILFPYGKDHLTANIPDDRLTASLTAPIADYTSSMEPEALIQNALENPVKGPKLCELAKGKEKVVIIASDHTRPVPSKLIIPPMLAEIRKGNPKADITILIATGCHRGTTIEELKAKFGEKTVSEEKIIVHDCDDTANLISIGTLPSGGELVINRLAFEADLLVSEGFIEPHFFAGFSGGRKSVLPGICSRTTVIYNHNGKFIDDPCSRTGILEGNPIHTDMSFAAKAAGLDFILNVILDSRKQPVYAVAGAPEAAHLKGCGFLSSLCRCSAPASDIVITTNGGYPLDQNIYQSVKGMTAAEPVVKEGGIIIMCSKCADGHGGEHFFNDINRADDMQELMNSFIATPPEKTAIDQWQTQIFARVLKKATVIFVSDQPDEMISKLHMIPAKNVEDAIIKADRILAQKGISRGSITAIPDGVSVITAQV